LNQSSEMEMLTISRPDVNERPENQKHGADMFPESEHRIHSVAGDVAYLVQSQQAHPALAQGIPPADLLNEAEAARFAALKTEKRRRDWLLGRWTAKHLVRQWVWQKTAEWLPLAAVEIGNDADGAPIVNGHWSLSISHSNGYAFCAVAEGGALGADMERIEPRIEHFAADYFTVEELDRLPVTDDRLRDTMVTAVWSAKEAALKALHLGLRVDTRAVSCLIDPVVALPQQWTSFAIQVDGRRLNRATARLTGWWRTMDNFVLTMAAELV
jgi:4'-phosphopantetheinyl transferase